jgi:HlyD family secretion protein
MNLRAVFNRKRLGWAAAGVLVLIALAWAFAPRPVQVETAVVERGAFEQSIDEDGRTRLRDRYTVSAPVAARMARIRLREGDAVKAGDVVAELAPVMPSMLDERSVREATARLRAAEAGVAAAQARAGQARVARAQAQQELDRTEQLARGGFVSGARLDSARLALQGAQREAEAAAAAREVAAQERALAAAALQPAGAGAQRMLPVRAPVAGVVLHVPQQSEATIPAGTALLDIGDPSRMEVVAELLTTDAVQAKPGTRAVIERWGGPPVQGRVRLVEPSARTKVSALGIEEQRVNVLIDVDQPPPEWRAMGDGFRVTARIVTVSTGDAVLVPVGALFPHADGGMAVYLLEDGRAKLQPVELAARNGSTGWVRSGVAPGQGVIVYPPPEVRDGTRVSVRKP